ncbi:MAG: hypothetical protein KIT84_36865 [Labilithrix sp.]|nr:hypothetical protein [Labilithrix sp.]MCW5816629.1 hypothetical protein [Labilithrix sp.]
MGRRGAAFGVVVVVVAACGVYGEDSDRIAPAPEVKGDASTTLEASSSRPCGCGPHETCDESSGAPVCSCATGYTRADEGAPCAWTGGPRDPGFQNDPAGAWTTFDGATVDPSIAGRVDPGILRFNQTLLSSPQGGAEQSFAMPAYADAEPFALVVSPFCDSGCNFPLITVHLDGRRHSLGRITAPSRTCLGDRGYGGVLRLRLSAGSVAFPSGAMMGLDNVAIEPAPDCPLPGVVVNGDFESTGGWVASGEGAEVTLSGGTGGGRAGRLRPAKACDAPTLAATLSVPGASMANPALRFTLRGTTGDRMAVEVGGTSIGAATGKNVFETLNACLPEWSRGLTLPLRFSPIRANGAACDAPNDAEFLIDDVEVVSDPTCADLVDDGGFERTSSFSPWRTSFSGMGSFVRERSNPRSGAGYGVLQSDCSSASLTQMVTIPDPAPGMGGPQLRYWYKAFQSGPVKFSGPAEMAPASTWTLATACLDPKASDRPYSLSFSLLGDTGCTSASLHLDDVAIVHDRSCPE